MKADNELLKNLDKLHTAELDIERIKTGIANDFLCIICNRKLFEKSKRISDEKSTSNN